ncbi:MAG TPA: hypothetical protein PLL30_04145 [Candidatus Krumholzibacteria bacterium]|nr:hypothetical protein [Candidatus Krumholzibacteria bacterium]HPD70964.1 hypothetical protein [Candidatus Krumholzibacteria bacterium]HRY39336.1 hypothetical protein [Candidatus Krumholzibacteria bacterium]
MGPLGAAPRPPAATWDLAGRVVANGPVSQGLRVLDVELPRAIDFLPGQFAMLNLTGPARLVFRRPFSILATAGRTISFLYRAIGRGTSLMAGLAPGAAVECLAPLGQPFPAPAAATPPVLILAGGVGLPPLYAWFARYRRPADLACFGGRDLDDVPWDLVPPPWQVSVDRLDGAAARSVFHGLVTELALACVGEPGDATPRLVLACGPTPLLRAAARLARERGWPCRVSLEEHMGCGYGVCKGCVVPVRDPGPPGWRHATSCTEGPVFDAALIDWDRFGHAAAGGPA